MTELQTILDILNELKESIDSIREKICPSPPPPPPKPKLISPFATLNQPITGTPNQPIFSTRNPLNTPFAPVKQTPTMNILSDSPILNVGQARDFLGNCMFSLSSVGYRLKEPSFEVRKKNLQNAVERFTYQEVLLKLYSLWFVWKENGVQMYVDRLVEDIQEVKRNRIHVQVSNESKVHLSPYGYSMKEPNSNVRFQALDKAIQAFTKNHVLNHLTQITHIWISKLSFAQFRKNTQRINEYSQYVQNLTPDYNYVFSR